MKARKDVNDPTRHDMQIATKLLLLICTSVIVSCIAVAAISLIIFNNGFKKKVTNDLGYTADGVQLSADDWKSTLEGIALALSDRPDILQSSFTGNYENLQKRLKANKKRCKLTFCVLLTLQAELLQEAEKIFQAA